MFGANRYLSAGAELDHHADFRRLAGRCGAAGGAEYLAMTALLSVIVGVFLAGAGLFRAGWVANLFSIPVLTGFLGGIAVHIALSQAPAFLGLAAGSGTSYDRVLQIARQIGEVNPLALTIGLSCLAFIVVVERLSARVPAPLLALAGATVAAVMLGLESKGLPTVGAFQVTPPHFGAPIVDPDDFSKVLGLAGIIAVVVMVQSAATSRSFPGLPGEAPDIDRDFFGLGLGSILSGLFGAFPVNASPPRTAIVAEAGGETADRRSRCGGGGRFGRDFR